MSSGAVVFIGGGFYTQMLQIRDVFLGQVEGMLIVLVIYSGEIIVPENNTL